MGQDQEPRTGRSRSEHGPTQTLYTDEGSRDHGGELGPEGRVAESTTPSPTHKDTANERRNGNDAEEATDVAAQTSESHRAEEVSPCKASRGPIHRMGQVSSVMNRPQHEGTKTRGVDESANRENEQRTLPNVGRYAAATRITTQTRTRERGKSTEKKRKIATVRPDQRKLKKSEDTEKEGARRSQ